MSCFYFSSGQDSFEQLIRSESTTFNEFKNNSVALEQIRAYADTVYPKGRIIFNSENAASLDFSDIPDLLSADPESTFNLVSEKASKFDPNRVYYKYQQYHQGIRVDNGGYTILAASPGTSIGCNQSSLYGISPAIATGIDINTTANFTQEDIVKKIENNFSVTVNNISELSIVWGLSEESIYNLTYKVDFRSEGKSYRKWIDALSGAVLKTANTSSNLFATTIHYCDQDLDDSPVPGGGTILETQDGILRTYFFPDNLDPFVPENYTQNLIPVTNSGQWDNPAVRIAVYQAHFCATNVIPEYNELIEGIDEFTNVNIAVSGNASSGINEDGKDMDNAFFCIGRSDPGGSQATHDIVAHELTHVFLDEYLSSNETGPRSLTEAICDVFGTYLESIVQNNESILCTQDGIDWVIGDDNPQLSGRNLENPVISTWEEALEEEEPHRRGLVIGHWFYLISEGSPEPGGFSIPGLGIERATNIVLEAVLNLENRDADFPDFRESVEMVVDATWGRCSEESVSVRNAFRKVGLSDGEHCAFVNVRHKYCEKNDAMLICATGGFENDHFRWYFPDGWTVPGSTGNILEDRRCLRVTDLPTYEYYPQNLTITLYDVTNQNRVDYKIRLEDCEGDDPTCNDVALNAIPPSSSAQERSIDLTDTEAFTFLKIFDINGRKVYEGRNSNEDFILKNSNGLLIYCYYDKHGKIINSKKVINLN